MGLLIMLVGQNSFVGDHPGPETHGSLVEKIVDQIPVKVDLSGRHLCPLDLKERGEAMPAFQFGNFTVVCRSLCLKTPKRPQYHGFFPVMGQMAAFVAIDIYNRFHFALIRLPGFHR
jgi:hypothetical protein